MAHTHSAAYDHIVIPLLCRPGTLVDIGANEGQYLQYFLNVPNSKVVAFEPVVETYFMLCLNLLQANGGSMPPHVTVYNAAAGADFGVAPISIPRVNGERAHHSASLAKDFATAQASPYAVLDDVKQNTLIVPLDHFKLTDVAFIKIDVEGFEKEAIRGGYDTISRYKPVLHIEIEEQHRKKATREVPALLASIGYRGFFFMDDRVVDFTDFDATSMQQPPPPLRSGLPYPDPYVFNFMFIHREDSWALMRIAELAAHLMTDGLLAAGKS